MKNKKSPQKSAGHRLICPECGHTQRFIEVMAEEAHIVDGNFNYIRLLEGIVDHYICSMCSASFEIKESAAI